MTNKTHAEMIREALETLGRAKPNEIMNYIRKKYPNIDVKPDSFRADMIGCSINHSSNKHYPGMPRFLYFHEEDKTYSINQSSSSRYKTRGGQSSTYNTNLAAEQPEGKAGESKGSAATGYKAIELKLIDINKKLSAIDGKVDESMKEGNRLTLGVVGFSVAMAGTMFWIQTKMRCPVSDFLIFMGIYLMILAQLLPKLQGKASLKKITRIAFIVALAVLFIYAIVFIVIVT